VHYKLLNLNPRQPNLWINEKKLAISLIMIDDMTYNNLSVSLNVSCTFNIH